MGDLQLQKSSWTPSLQAKSTSLSPTSWSSATPDSDDGSLTPSQQRPEEDDQANQLEVQTQLTIGQPGDPYEMEADTVAQQVMSMPDPSPEIQRLSDDPQEQQWLQGKTVQPPPWSPIAASTSPFSGHHPVQRRVRFSQIGWSDRVQRKAQTESQSTANLESTLTQSKGGGSPLPDHVQAFMSPRLGANLSSIRVHTDSTSVQMNQQLGAQAFAHGNHIYYGAGKGPGNDHLTAHELTHTIQQGATQPLQAKSEPGSSFDSSPTGSLIDLKLRRETEWMTRTVRRLQDPDLVLQPSPVEVKHSTQEQVRGDMIDWVLPDELVEAKEMLTQLLSGASGVILSILKNPVRFLRNLTNGLGNGFRNFLGNIGEHIQEGLVGWLTGAMGSMGIEMPQNVFSLKGIFSLVIQVLGATWTQVRTRIISAIPGGEQAMAALEEGTEIFQIAMKEGIGGLWEYVKDQFGDLKGQILDELQNAVVMQGIQQGILFILSMLNPVTGIVRAAKAIIDLIRFFVENGSRVAALVESVIGSVKAVSEGALEQAAQLVESALGRSIPVLLGFLSSVAGLGNLVAKARKIFDKMREPVDKAVSWLIKKAKDLVRQLGHKLGLTQESGRESTSNDTDEDKEKHKQIANAIVSDLNAPSDKGTETIIELYEVKKREGGELEKGIKLSIPFEKPKQDAEKIKYKIIIKPNDLIEEHFIEDDNPGDKEVLVDWPRAINSDPGNNKLASLKGKEIPKTLHVRISRVKGNMLAVSENNKLSILEGRNMYRYSEHAVYLKGNVIDSVNKGEDRYIDSVVHEFDHAVRINTRSQNAYTQVKSEIFAFHAQMLTCLGTGKTYRQAIEVHVAKKLRDYVRIYKYGDDTEDPQDRLETFFNEIYRENGQAKTKLSQIIAFLDIGDSDPERAITKNEIEAESSVYGRVSASQTLLTARF